MSRKKMLIELYVINFGYEGWKAQGVWKKTRLNEVSCEKEEVLRVRASLTSHL